MSPVAAALVATRFLLSVKITDGCWEWQGSLNPDGYGRFENTTAQRFAYELLVGPVPDHWKVDHLCRNHACVRPDHLEAVSNRENTLRGKAGRLTTKCVRGHAYTPENTTWRANGRRGCRTCAREDMAKKRNAGYKPPGRRRRGGPTDQ